MQFKQTLYDGVTHCTVDSGGCVGEHGGASGITENSHAMEFVGETLDDGPHMGAYRRPSNTWSWCTNLSLALIETDVSS